jgi:uncharacterized protein YbjT (DUF2867 family)
VRVLVLGASGFIGSAVCERLLADGHEVVGLSRSPPRGTHPRMNYVAFDIGAARTPEQWTPVLHGISAVVNCAGTLQDAPGDSVHGVHERGIATLVSACESSGVRRFVQLSAIGVDRGTPTAFSRSKLNGDRAVAASSLDWIILRPSVVIGRSAYGGSALLRGLAALPVLPVLPDSGPLQLVHLDDVVETVALCVRPDAPARQAMDLAGPRQWSFFDAVALFRRWLRWPQAHRVNVPPLLAALLYRLGDAAALLGWRTPMRSTAQLEIRRGAVGEPDRWTRLTGIVPRDIEEWLRREPASAQDRWFARLYMLKPVVILLFGLYWIATGIVSLTAGWPQGLAPLADAGLPARAAVVIVAAGAAADIIIGCAILYRPAAWYGLCAALGLSLVYLAIATAVLPGLWGEPLGPLLKVVPIVLLNLVALAILPER